MIIPVVPEIIIIAVTAGFVRLALGFWPVVESVTGVDLAVTILS